MNERLRELAKQASIMVDTTFGQTTMPEYKAQVDLNKFAELIVRECMSQIEEVRQIKAGNPGPVYTQGFDDGMFVAIRTIEEHFRVEE